MKRKISANRVKRTVDVLDVAVGELQGIVAGTGYRRADGTPQPSVVDQLAVLMAAHERRPSVRLARYYGKLAYRARLRLRSLAARARQFLRSVPAEGEGGGVGVGEGDRPLGGG